MLRGGWEKRAKKKKKFPGCPSVSYQSVIHARRPPSSVAILRQHPGPQDAAGNSAGHQERCDNVTGCSRRGTLNTHVHVHTQILKHTPAHPVYTHADPCTQKRHTHRKGTLQQETQRQAPAPSEIVKLSRPHKTETRNTVRQISENPYYIWPLIKVS